MSTNDKKVRAFFMEKIMRKPEKDRIKENSKKRGKVWVQIPTPFEERVTGSGVTFRGMFIPRKEGDRK